MIYLNMESLGDWVDCHPPSTTIIGTSKTAYCFILRKQTPPEG